jgi:hypothetical protein
MNVLTTPTIVKLSNGKKVANFSSPHEFKFEDGTVLPAHTPEHANHYRVDMWEHEMDDESGDIILGFKLSPQVIELMGDWHKLWIYDDVDVVFCPLPMITAIKEHANFGLSYLSNSPFRGVRIPDRINKLVSISKQCL